jgi:hypothetical protein
MLQEEGFKFCSKTGHNGALPLDGAWPERLSVQSLAGLPNNRTKNPLNQTQKIKIKKFEKW